MKNNKVLLNLTSIIFAIICCSGFSFLMPFRIYLIGIFGVLIVLISFKNNDIKLFINKSNLFLVFFVALIIIGLINSYDKFETMKYLYVYLAVLIMCITYLDESFVHKSLNIIGVVSKIVAISIILNALIPNLFTDYLYVLIRGGKTAIPRLTNEVSSGIYSGLMGEKGEAAFLMSIAIIWSLSKMNYGKKSNKDIFWLIIFFVALILPAKRMMFVIIAIILLLWIILWSRKKQKLKNFSIIICVSIILFSLAYNIPQFRTLVDRFLEYSGDNTANGRVYLWECALKMFSEKPILGYGFGSYNRYSSDFGVVIAHGEEWLSHAHNIYFQLLAEMGIIGLITFLIINFITILSFIRVYKKKRYLKQSDLFLLEFSSFIIFFIIIYGLSGNSIYYTNQVFIYFFSIAIVNYLSNKYRNISIERGVNL